MVKVSRHTNAYLITALIEGHIMKFRIQILLMLIFFMSPVAIANSQSELDFIARYQVDPATAHILDAHAEDILAHLHRIQKHNITEHETWTFRWLPGYIVKFNLERIHGMEKMRRCIVKHNLDLLTLPDKRIYHVKGRPTLLNNMNYVVVIKMIETDPNRQPMTPRHIEQLIVLMEETGYISTTATNYIRTYHGKLAMIDTESTFDKSKLLSKGYMRLISAYHKVKKDYTKEALQYLLTRMAVEFLRYSKSDYKAIYTEIKDQLKKASITDWDPSEFFDNQVQAHQNLTSKKRTRKTHAKRNKKISALVHHLIN